MKNRSGNKLIIVFLIFILIALVAGGAYAYFMTDLFKTPEQLFKKYLINGVAQITQSNFEPFNEISERSENENSEFNMDINVDLSSMSTEDSKYDANLKLISDVKNSNASLDITIDKEDTEILKGTLAVTDETFGLHVPDIHEKYIALENRDFKKLAKTAGLSDEEIEKIPDSLEISTPFTDAEIEKINELTKKYYENIAAQLEENNYIAEKNINVTVGEENVVANKYTLNVSSKKLFTILTETVTDILNDPEVSALLEGRIDEKQFEEMKASYEDALAETDVNDIEDKTIEIAVYAQKGKTVKTELKVDESIISYYIKNTETDSKIVFTVLEPQTETNKVESITTVTLANTYSNGNGELSYELKNEYNQDHVKELSDSSESSYFSSDYYSEMYANQYAKYTLKTKKTNDNLYKINISLDGEQFEEINDMLKLSFSYEFGDMEAATITDKNSIIVNDYSMTDFQNLFTEITANITKTATENPDSLIGMIFVSTMTPNEDAYSPSYDDYYNTYEDSDTTFEEPEIYDPIPDVEEEPIVEENPDEDMVYVDVEALRDNVRIAVTDGLNDSLNKYKEELLNNPEANLGDFLTVENLQAYCGPVYKFELIDGTTLKAVINLGSVEYIYYALMNIDGTNLVVTEVEVLTETEYNNR